MRAPLPLLLLLLACQGPDPKDTGEPPVLPVDADGDGYDDSQDCDDGDASIHPGATEICDGRDDDCDGESDEDASDAPTWYLDQDGDDFGDAAQPTSACQAPPDYAATADDCDDAAATTYPDAPEICDGLDQDCDGLVDEDFDLDGDGWAAAALCPEGVGGDCDDGDASVYPGAEEVCDLDDDDCDGRPDLGVVSRWYTDEDGDGYGHPAHWQDTCNPDPTWVLVGTDCSPGDASIHPDAPEECDGWDQDCDGLIDEDFDLDGDGHESSACDGGDDCDDLAGDVFPGQYEICDDGVDNDCDGHDALCGLDGSYSLATANAKLYCPNASFDAGRVVTAGDVNGDGQGDLLIATYYADSANGGAYLVYGPVTGTWDLDTVGLRLRGERSTYNAGRSAALGDANGDGLEDIWLGAPHSTDGSGYLFYGPLSDSVNLVDADVLIRGPTNTEFGHGSDLADINGDGLEDVAVGAYEDLGSMTGAVYVKYAPFSSTEDLVNDADAVLLGIAPMDQTANALRAGGDLDGDGIGDLLVPAIYADVGGPQSGSVYVLYGPVSGSISLSDADGTLVGEGSSDYAGEELAMGDMDGDGLFDAVVGSMNSTMATNAGGTYVVFGPAAGDTDLGAANAIVRGDKANQKAGAGVATGDVDGDGFYDLAVGATGDTTAGANAGAVFFFQGPLTGTWLVSDAQAVLTGEAGSDTAGEGLAFYDLDGDGWGDLIIGANGERTGGSGAGAVYIQRAEH